MVLMGSDPDKCLLLWKNRCNLGWFLLLGPGFWGQKVGFKDFAWGFLNGELRTGVTFHIALLRLSGGKVSSLYGIEYISYQSVETPFPGCRYG